MDEIPKFVDEFKHTAPEILTFFHGHLYFQRRLPDGGISGQKKKNNYKLTNSKKCYFISYKFDF
jgi:cupin superfamily acireductone dioxygenase involved in methionine salvage